MLCEVALGDIHELKVFDKSLKSSPDGKHSVEGVGNLVNKPEQSSAAWMNHSLRYKNTSTNGK